MQTSWHKRSQKAQGMVEFALVLPVLLLLILAIFAFGHFLFAYITTVSASREAARYGAAVGPSENGLARFEDCQAIRNAAVRVGSIIGLSTVAIHFDNGTSLKEQCPANGGPLPNPGNIGLGDRIVVEVVTNYRPIVPLVNIPSFPITSRSTRTILRNAPVGTAAVAMPVQSASKQNTTLTIISDNPDYSIVGAPVDVYFTLTYTGSQAAPTGNVTIVGSDDNPSDGSNDASCTVAISAGHCVITPMSPGPWTLTATYVGDNNYNGSTDTEPHHVYYLTAVDITAHDPNPSIAGSGVDVLVYYSFTVTPPLVNGGRTPGKMLTITDGTTTCSAATTTTGPCVIPAYNEPYDRDIVITYPDDDPYFLGSTKMVDHEVNAGLPTITTINEIVYVPPAGTGPRPYFEIGDQVKIRFEVKSAVPATDRPSGKVVVTDQTGLRCEGDIDSNGFGECSLMLATRGPSGTLNFTAQFQPNNWLFDDSKGTYTLNVNKIKPVLTVLGHTPDPSGVNNFVRVTFRAAPASSAVLLPVGGKVRVTIAPDGATCEGVLDSTGQGFCDVRIPTIGTKTILLDYIQGDNNYEGPSSQPVVPTHLVTDCPTLTYRTFYNTGTGADKKSVAQMIVTVTNPTTDRNFRLVQVNANWPSDVQTVYIKELQLGPVGQSAEGKDWDCDPNGNKKDAKYCLWESANNLGMISYEGAGRDYFTSAAGGTTQPFIGLDGILEPTGTVATWKTLNDQTLANTLFTPGMSQDLYFILSVNAPKLGVFKVRARFNSQTCPWAITEFYNNTP